MVKWNRKHLFLLTVIDIFSKYAFARPLKSKKSTDVAEAFADIIETSGRKCSLLQSDQGKEFLGKPFQTVLKKYNIQHYYTYSDKKASIVERWNRTLKGRMYRSFTERNSLNWIDTLPQLVSEYNDTKHRTIGRKPIKVTKENENEVWHYIRRNRSSRKSSVKKKFKLGDIVRVSRVKSIFTKGYKPNWTEELFKICKVSNTIPQTYHLEDLLGMPIRGSFYTEELQKTKIPNYARIEKILSRKTTADGNNWIRVKWKGYDNRFNQWLPLESTTKL